MTLTCCQDHILTENIRFVWSKTSYSGDEMRCYRCGTNNQTVKIELLSQWKLDWRLSFAITWRRQFQWSFHNGPAPGWGPGWAQRQVLAGQRTLTCFPGSWRRNSCHTLGKPTGRKFWNLKRIWINFKESGDSKITIFSSRVIFSCHLTAQ